MFREGKIKILNRGRGNAVLVWTVDAAELEAALAGRDESTFQTIINGFASIQQARSRIEPFWNSSFPSNTADIKVDIVSPAVTQ